MIIYTVKAGDTLNGIAQIYGTTAQTLTDANGMANPDDLAVGQTVVIPGDTTKIGELASSGYAYTFIGDSALYGSLPYLTYFTVFTYGFTRSGELISPDDERFPPVISGAGAVPVMTVSTLTENGGFSNELSEYLLNNRDIRETLVDNILINMREKGYRGLDFDIEYISGYQAEAYADFVGYTRERLNSEGYFVVTALAPKTYAEQPGLLYEGHDYARIGSASDFVLLMTYEWGYTYGPPMAVAPLGNVRRVLEYGISEIPPEKIFMGIPNYGYDWTLPYIRGESKARTISNNEAPALAASYRAEIFFDEDAQSPYFNYTDEEGSAHEVWFEDARSIQSKLALANEFKLYGISYWNLMRYFPQTFTVLSEEYDIIRL